MELSGIEKVYGSGENQVAILKGIDLCIEKGEFVALMGPSGSGKSTLLNIIGCLDKPTRGRLLLFSRDISQVDEDELAAIRRDKLGFVFQSFNLIGRISVQRNVEMPMTLAGVPGEIRRERAIELLKRLGLEHRINFSPLDISGGERQRVAIARALANDPEMIIADEPTGNLDFKNSIDVMNILSELNQEGRTIIMVTHNPETIDPIGYALVGLYVVVEDDLIVWTYHSNLVVIAV